MKWRLKLPEIYELLDRIKEQKPLIHHITNWVTIYDCANITRAIGALPVMAHAIEEVADMTSIASGLVLNIGTLTPELIESMIIAGKKANQMGIPVLLDAVGVGATALRTDSANKIIDELKVDIIKGNSAEIAVLAGANAVVKGVEAMGVDGNLAGIATKFAKEKNACVVMTGVQDIVSNGKDTYLIDNGHKMMGAIVGTGCMASSVICSFSAVEKNYAFATTSALVCFGIAGELAARASKGPGTFKEAFYDEIYDLDKEKITTFQKYKKVGSSDLGV
jgi:hydroxyethylthiazole kinase